MKKTLLIFLLSTCVLNHSSIKNFRFTRHVIMALKRLDADILADIALASRDSLKIDLVESRLFSNKRNLSEAEFKNFEKETNQALCSLGICEQRDDGVYIKSEAAKIINNCVVIRSGMDSDLPFYVYVRFAPFLSLGSLFR